MTRLRLGYLLVWFVGLLCLVLPRLCGSTGEVILWSYPLGVGLVVGASYLLLKLP